MGAGACVGKRCCHERVIDCVAIGCVVVCLAYDGVLVARVGVGWYGMEERARQAGCH